MKIKARLFGVCVALLVGCQSDQATQLGTLPLATLTVINPSAFDRSDEAIVVNGAQLGLEDGQAISVKDQDKVLESQWIDRDSNGSLESLVVLAQLKAGAKHSLQVLGAAPTATPARVSAEVSVKEGGQWQGQNYVGGDFKSVEALVTPPQYTDHSEYIRYEGPGIESELVGYRLYLDWRNGLDVFGKTQPKLVLDQVGLDGYQSYHELADWGMDVLKVGQSAGLGGFGAWQNNEVERVSDVSSRGVKVNASGPVYAQLELQYEQWNTGTSVAYLEAQLSMMAGSRWVEARVKSDPHLRELAVTIPKHPKGKVFFGNTDITGHAWSYLATFGPQAMSGEPLGLAVFFKRRQFREFSEDEHNNVVVMKSNAGDFRYFFGATWGGESQSNWTEQSFLEAVEQNVERLTLLPRVEIDSAYSQHQKKAFGQSAAEFATKAAESEIRRHDQELAFGAYDSMRLRDANWEYTMGLLTQAIYEHGAHISDPELQQWAQGIVDSYITEEGDIRTYRLEEFNIDRINSGKILLRLYKDTGEEKYWIAAGHLREQLRQHPKLEAGPYWHKKRYPFQLWLDGVYMALPFLAEYALMTQDDAAIEQVIHEFEVARQFMRDAESGLYYHAWDEAKEQGWANPETGLSSYFWGRGMGWYAMALADTLAILQGEPEDRLEPLRAMAVEFATDILKYRSPRGLWYQILDRGEQIGNYEESSVTAMFTYFLAKGANIGVLSDTFGDAALASYAAMLEHFVLVDKHEQHHFTQVCHVGGLGYGRDGSYAYYMSEPILDNDPKGLGPYIMLGQQIESLRASSH